MRSMKIVSRKTLLGFLLAIFAAAPIIWADDNLGTVVAIRIPPSGIPVHNHPATGATLRRDSAGHLYIDTGQGRVEFPPGTEVIVSDPMGNPKEYDEPGAPPPPPPPPPEFPEPAIDIQPIPHEIAPPTGTTPETPVELLPFYPLVDPNAAELLMDAGVDIDPALGPPFGFLEFLFNGTTESILASLTPDGATPVEFSWDPLLEGFGAQMQSDLSFLFESQSPFPVEIGSTVLVTGTEVPELGSFPLFCTVLVLIGWALWRKARLTSF